MSHTSSVITATGSYLPKHILTNYELEKTVDTSDEWIKSRTGIHQRHIAAKDEFTSHMATHAAKRALEKSNLSPHDIGMIIVATTTPDQTFPSVATKVQAELGATNAGAFDVQAVCSGFIYALSIADLYIKSGTIEHVLVIGAEKMSSIIDWNDRRTCILFGDGAGAIILSKSHDANRGILSSHLYADGSHRDILQTDGGTASTGNAGFIHMDGQEVFKHAIHKMADALLAALTINHLSIDQIDWLVPHQANSRIIDMLAKKLQVDSARVVSCVAEHANTSAASIPLALDHAASLNLFKKEQLLAFVAIGGGLTWASCLLRW